MITTLSAGARGFDTASNLTEKTLDLAKADGISYITKYVPYGNAAKSKFWKSQEIQWCFDRGIAVLAVWEVDETRPLGGEPQGHLDGAQARGSMSHLGFPEDLFILSAADFDVYSRNSTPVLAYLKAFGWTCGGGIAAYGDEDVADGLIGSNPIIWLPNAAGWSRSVKAAGTSQAARVNAARHIPGVCFYQFPTTVAYNLSIDPGLVLQPVRAWAKTTIVPPTPPQPPLTEDHMATAHITIEGRHAEFYGTGTLQPDGNVDVIFITWSGSGDDPNNHFIGDHNASPVIVPQHYSPDTLKRDLVLIGDPSEIQDNAWTWSRGDFFRTS